MALWQEGSLDYINLQSHLIIHYNDNYNKKSNGGNGKGKYKDDSAFWLGIVVAFIVIRKDEENKEIDEERIIRFNDNSESGETNEEN